MNIVKDKIEKKIKEDDRRVKRSLKLLKLGLIELMEKKSFSEISVKELTDHADMNRGTFYLHFSDTSELLKSITEDLLLDARTLLDENKEKIVEAGSIRPVFESLLDLVVKNRKTCELLLNNNEASAFSDKLQLLFQQYGKDILEARYHKDNDKEYAYLISYTTYGLMGMLKTWFESGMTMPKEDLFGMADKMMNGSAVGLIEE